MVYNDPLLSLINKIKEDSDVRNLLPSYNNIFNSYIPDSPIVPSIYVYRTKGEETPILTFDKIKNPTLLINGSTWKLSSLHNLSIEHSKELGCVACNSILPSIVEAGLFSLKYTYNGSYIDESFVYPFYRSDFVIKCLTQNGSV